MRPELSGPVAKGRTFRPAHKPAAEFGAGNDPERGHVPGGTAQLAVPDLSMGAAARHNASRIRELPEFACMLGQGLSGILVPGFRGRAKLRNSAARSVCARTGDLECAILSTACRKKLTQRCRARHAVELQWRPAAHVVSIERNARSRMRLAVEPRVSVDRDCSAPVQPSCRSILPPMKGPGAERGAAGLRQSEPVLRGKACNGDLENPVRPLRQAQQLLPRGPRSP